MARGGRFETRHQINKGTAMKVTSITAVGQVLYFASDVKWESSRTVVVEKIGRTWATLNNGHRADKATGNLDAGGLNPPGVLYESEQSYRATMDANKAHRSFRDEIGYRPRDGVTAEDIRKAAELLRIDIST